MNKRTFILSVVFLLLTLGVGYAQNITGTITSGGKPIQGVAVSDGDVVVQTDKDGRYSITSEKRNGYVFYTLPSGYEPEVRDGFAPQFWQLLNSNNVADKEVHDFTLRKVKNNKFRFIVGTDAHLANRSRDVSQFSKMFITRINEEKASAGQTPIYSTILGDMAWDNYWYSNNYDLPAFVNTLTQNKYPVILFPVMGNHDNDGATKPNENTDFNASAVFRKVMAPNYYSCNIGKIHYVVLDNIYYINKDKGGKYNKNIAGLRNYDGYITPEQFEWLKKDLALVDKNTPIIIGCHIPVWRLTKHYQPIEGLTQRYNSTQKLCDLLKPFKTVHIVSGHTHYNYHCYPKNYPNLHENNIGAICATWWNTGYESGRHICKDGSPGGYAVYYVNGKKIRWEYHSMEGLENPQFGVYDMNTIKSYYRNNEVIGKILKKYPSRQDYGSMEDNVLLVNVYNYDESWKIDIRENGKRREPQRVFVEDPLHTLSYDVPCFRKNGKYGEGSATNLCYHMFKVQCSTADAPVIVKITDRFGKVYKKKINRPLPYTIDMNH